MEVKVELQGIDNLKTTTAVKVETDKDGDVIDRRLITKVQFECEVPPAGLADVHRLLEAGSLVVVTISSPQSVFDMTSKPKAKREVAAVGAS